MNTSQQINDLREYWKLLFPFDVPSDRQFAIWLMAHSVNTVRKGIASAALKYGRLNGSMSFDYATKFASAVMIRLSDEQQQGSK